MQRIGFGFDAHRFSSETRLVLGGVSRSSSGSRATRTPMSSHTLYATRAPRRGRRGATSAHTSRIKTPNGRTLPASPFKEILSLLGSKGYSVVNIDTVIVCEKPRISPTSPK
ncbi:MAG: hypothetical protein R3B51_11205 [Thermodesulfobacteriota bacterium]